MVRTRRTPVILTLAAMVLVGGMIPALSGVASAETVAGPRQRHHDIWITKDAEFDPAHGVRSGSGTASDPYVISGWDVGTLYIKDTSAYVRIVDNTIRRLTLDWIGPGAVVQNNDVGDLRVNQNVRRTGDPTSGVISHNTFGVVGQLRHFDGAFEHNTVGDPESFFSDRPFFEQRAVNFDGFNGARFRNNTIYGGYVEARLHGHHHSSSFTDDSHYHGVEKEEAHREHTGHDMSETDHSQRYHRVYISNNKIYNHGYYGLLYTDTAHAANDRTAASEQNPALNKPHVHYTRVFLTNNELVGSGITVNVFNAQDKEKHVGTATGLVKIAGNSVTLERRDTDVFHRLVGIDVHRAQDVRVLISDNTITGIAPKEDSIEPVQSWVQRPSTGIFLNDIDKANIYISNNVLKQHEMGIQASRFTKSVYWFISGLRTEDVQHDVYWNGNDVPNAPDEKP